MSRRRKKIVVIIIIIIININNDSNNTHSYTLSLICVRDNLWYSRESTTSVLETGKMANKPPKTGESLMNKLYRREVQFKVLYLCMQRFSTSLFFAFTKSADFVEIMDKLMDFKS